MRIVVKENEGRRIRILMPTGLVFNGVTAGIASKQLEKYGTNITRKQMMALIKAMKRYRRAHPEWVLVEVRDADGDFVQVKL